MKNLKTIAIALFLTFSVAIAAQTRQIDATKSKITWVGKKVTGQHEGTVKFKEGAVAFKGKKLSGGNFIIDMTTINTTDLKAGEGKEKLDKHLKDNDFFGVEKHPTATLIFKTIADKGKNVYTINADLTIKGITQPVIFNILVNGNKATSFFKVDRTKYDIKYGSGSFFDNLGDKAITDEFELAVELSF